MTVTNTGTGALNLTGIGIAVGSDVFGKSDNCGNLAINGTCSVDVMFTPILSGYVGGTLGFAHSGGGLAFVQLTGTGQLSSAVLVGPSFAATTVGATSSASATLFNTGVGPLQITAPSSSSVTGANFSFLSSNCPALLSVGTTCAVALQFAPTSTAAAVGQLVLSTGAGVKEVSLMGVALQAAGTLSAGSGASASFGGVSVGSSATQVITFSNTGNAAAASVTPSVTSEVGLAIQTDKSTPPIAAKAV